MCNQNLLNRFSSLITLAFLSIAVTAQTSFKEGLNTWNNQELHDTSRLKAILESSKEIWRSEPNRALVLLFKGLPLAEHLGETWHVSFLELISNSYAIQSNYDSSNYYCHKAVNGAISSISPNDLSGFHNKLGLAYSELGPHDSAIKHLNLAKQYALQAEDTSKVAHSVLNLARLLAFKGDYQRAEGLFKEASSLTRGTRFKREDAYLRSNWGGLKVAQGDFNGGLQLMIEALKQHDAMGDIPGQANVEGQIGNVYREIKEYSLSIKYLNSSMLKAQNLGNELQFAGSLVELATTYNYMGKYDSSISAAGKALTVFQKLQYPEGIGIAKSTIGLNYLMMKQYHKAIKNFKGAIAVGKKHQLNFDMLYSNLAKAYFGLAMYAKAIKFGLIAEKEAKAKGAWLELKQAVGVLQEGYVKLGNYEKAYQYLKLQTELIDSLADEDLHRELVHKEYEYQYKKEALADSLKQVQLDLNTRLKHQSEIDQKNRTRNALVGSGLLLLTLAGGIWNRSRYIKKSNKQLAKEKRRAEKSEAFKQQFLANMSHEIRTPMNAILGMTNLTLDTQLNEKQKNYLEGIKFSSESLLVIINDILDISKLEKGKLELEEIPFDLLKEIQQVHTTLKYKAEEKGLEFSARIPSTIPQVVYGDPSRLRQVLINLCGNAIKFTEKGEVDLFVSAEGNKIKFAVKDTGIGLAKENHEDLFESFKQADKGTTRKYGGTGLGLSISKTLVELMGGELKLESALGQGSEFFFSLQLKEASLDQLESRALYESDYSQLEGIRILLAEDNKYNQIVVLDTLKHLVKDSQVDLAKNGKEALELVQLKDYDLVLMDSDMPEMDGREAARKIRQLDSKKKDIPIIALTSSVLASEISKCLEAGMNDSIPKPFERVVFFKTIGKYYSRP